MSPAEARDRCRALAESCERRAEYNDDADEVLWLSVLAADLREIADSPE